MTSSPIYTRKEAAELLHVSLPTLDAYLRRAESPIPCIRFSATNKRGKILIPADSLHHWIDEEAQRNQGSAFRR